MRHGFRLVGSFEIWPKFTERLTGSTIDAALKLITSRPPRSHKAHGVLLSLGQV